MISTLRLKQFVALFTLSAATAQGQLPQRPGTLAPAPRSSPLAPAANLPPPREIPIVQKKFEQLTDQNLSADGAKALTINPEKWKHAETDNFVLHYRRATEAQKVAREVEYDLWFVATTLGATRDRYQKKSHVYVFEDETEWKEFLALSNNPLQWAVSYAYGDELFLNVRGKGGSGFDSHTLAHEATHAVVARLYPRQRWPLWLSEGFAEYMGGASIAARKGQSGKRYARALDAAEIPLSTLEKITEYPTDERAIGQLYQTSEKFIRFLMSEGPKDRIVKFIERILTGGSLQAAVLEIYGEQFKDWSAFERRYERFTR